MTTITLDKAKSDLPSLIDRALSGEEIVIARDGGAVKLAPIALPEVHEPEVGSSYRGFGVLKGQLIVGPEFFEPLSDEECGLGGESGAP